MTRTATMLALAAASNALADGPLQGTATWLWDVTTQDGDAIVEPGETASITLSLLMEPRDFNHAIIGAAIFDCIGDRAAYTGHVLGWEIHNQLANLTGDLTTTDGVSLFNTNVGQLTFQPVSYDNPVDVITFEWEPHDYRVLQVVYVTDSEILDEPHTVGVWEYNESSFKAQFGVYAVTEATITFTVVPAPAGALVLAAAGAPRRRRRN